ncbi:hypothetical protein CLOSTMETH_02258 [[Clostridium] methylpentosum DSM 5476]|uniref:Uncharacterized protein n=1 Tax=[Clostridium] methylpentosum DSM 5476 TaxID=537013 RepID=C0EEH2_9FIRM|nr:hypothetical protein CLOSTMETH_02258 [[Clostridium] methylpentosum DSM 5476]
MINNILHHIFLIRSGNGRKCVGKDICICCGCLFCFCLFRDNSLHTQYTIEIKNSRNRVLSNDSCCYGNCFLLSQQVEFDEMRKNSSTIICLG